MRRKEDNYTEKSMNDDTNGDKVHKKIEKIEDSLKRKGRSVICIKIRLLNAQIYVSKKFILNSLNSDLNLEQWQVKAESTERRDKILK